jgi:hypothetical protein
MIRIASGSANYIQFENHQGRDIQWPKPTLRRIQKRAADLLGRIETPDFLHSAKKGRSYITNADRHGSSLPSVKIDIRKFFQSVRAPAVFHFFKDKMLCAPDVAGIIARMFTLDKHLPTGGNVSPILSYFAYMDMFAEIDDLAKRSGCVMTCLYRVGCIWKPHLRGQAHSRPVSPLRSQNESLQGASGQDNHWSRHNDGGSSSPQQTPKSDCPGSPGSTCRAIGRIATPYPETCHRSGIRSCSSRFSLATASEVDSR